MPETAWERTKKFSSLAYAKTKPGFDKAWNTLDKLGAPVNRLSNRLGSEAFWPTTLDKESDKAARILRSFCKDGFYSKIDEQQAKKAEESGQNVEGPQGKQRVLKKIPEQVIREAKGLAIFTTMRTGLWVSGAGGSGVLVARHQETGEWSPPSGILLHTAGLGFLVGVDIYDCVVVINTYKALEAFTSVRCTLGGEVSAVAGPVGMGGVLDTEIHTRQAPVWTYLKSRGFYAGVQVDGTIVIERKDENEKFYGERIPVADILAGKARHPPKEQYRMLMATIKAAQGDDVDESLLPDAGQSPSDHEIDISGMAKHETRQLTFCSSSLCTIGTFGIPDSDDPDPYGVKALEAEGFSIREAGTHQRPSAEVFEFKPAPTSPIYSAFARRSVDSPRRHGTNSWRGSTQSLASIDRGTQTSEDNPISARSPNHSPSQDGNRRISPARKETEHVDEVDDHDDRHSHSGSVSDVDSNAEIETAVPMIARARVITVPKIMMPKRIPPALPPRNPNRVSTPVGENSGLKDDFERVSLNEHEDAKQSTDSDFRSIEGANNEGEETTGHLNPDNVDHNREDDFHSVPATPLESKEHDVPGSFS
jgi:lipid-binding SYLF domain-containing protein